MLNFWPAWRERGWTPIDSAAYREVWYRFGGSVATHPDFVERLSGLAGIPVRYFGWWQNQSLVAAVPTWGRHLALSKVVLKQSGQRRLFDLGNAEVILPIAPDVAVPMRWCLNYVADLQHKRITTLKPQKEQLAFARAPEHYKGRYRYNLRRDLRILQEAGGSIQPLVDFTYAERAAMYSDLFQKRWGFEVPGRSHMVEVFELLQAYMAGSVVFMAEQPVAIQLLYRVEAPEWISVEYINGGVDPQFNKYSPGSVLTWVNTQAAWEQARNAGKALRYSFGRDDREYKKQWCHSVPVWQV